VSCYAPWQKSVLGGGSRPIACGQCSGCRLERSRQWAVRCMHEASLHEKNSFVTLTYKDAPESLEYRDFQLFMKRLRKVRGRCRFYMGAEYGEQRGRPHFHALLFGVAWPDGVYLGKSPSGFKLFRSAQLSALWPQGFASVGDVTFESAAYVARYCMSVITGDKAVEHYGGRKPEFGRMSLRPGIGRAWIDKYGRSDVLPDGNVVVNGVKLVRLAITRKFFGRVFRCRTGLLKMLTRSWRVMQSRTVAMIVCVLRKR